jgi:hypothetical protein
VGTGLTGNRSKWETVQIAMGFEDTSRSTKVNTGDLLSSDAVPEQWLQQVQTKQQRKTATKQQRNKTAKQQQQRNNSNATTAARPNSKPTRPPASSAGQSPESDRTKRQMGEIGKPIDPSNRRRRRRRARKQAEQANKQTNKRAAGGPPGHAKPQARAVTKELDHNRAYLEAMHASHQHLRKEYRKLHALADLHDDDVRRSAHASQRVASLNRRAPRAARTVPHERRRCACVQPTSGSRIACRWRAGGGCNVSGLTPPTSAPGLGSPRPRLRRDWAHPAHVCTGTGLAPPTSAP